MQDRVPFLAALDAGKGARLGLHVRARGDLVGCCVTVVRKVDGEAGLENLAAVHDPGKREGIEACHRRDQVGGIHDLGERAEPNGAEARLRIVRSRGRERHQEAARQSPGGRGGAHPFHA